MERGMDMMKNYGEEPQAHEERAFNSLAAIKRMHEGVPVMPIEPLVAVLRAHDVPSRETIAQLCEGRDEAEMLRTELNAIAAYFIEHLWQDAAQWIEAHPPGLVQPVKKYEKERKPLEVYPAQEMRQVAAECIIPDQVVRILEMHTEGVMQHELKAWEQRMQAQHAQKESDFDTRAFARYKQIINTGQVTSAHDPAHHISRGIKTAEAVMWESLSIIPEVYAANRHALVSREGIETIARNNEALIMAMAGMNIRAISRNGEFMKLLRGGREGGTFAPEVFTIRGEDDAMRMDIRPDVFEEIGMIKDYSTPATTRCPALYAKGASGKNVIHEMYRWYLKLSEEFYFPHIDRLNERIRDNYRVAAP